MRHTIYYMLAATLLLSLAACKERRAEPEYTPWGTVVETEADGRDSTAMPDTAAALSVSDIVAQGEIIALTISGPQTYYDYHGHGLGVHYLLAERLAERLGVKLRVEVCKDTLALGRRLAAGEGDLVACPVKLPGTVACGPGWAVAKANTTLAAEIRRWYRPQMLAEAERRQKSLLASGGVTRHVYAPILNRQRGLISRWDPLFQKYAPTARLDWRLLAAQCYQESCFDPKAHSWAGACGLMQIMPGTAAELGLPLASIYQPEQNIAAAARYMRQLTLAFPEAATPYDRLCFALASYNGGRYHVNDAQALARKYGHDPRRWDDVAPFILRLSEARYYTDPVVHNGYMRGQETYGYVERIIRRWQDYGGRPGRSLRSGPTLAPSYTGPSTQPLTSPGAATPHAARHKHKYSI